MARVLIVEDDPVIASAVQKHIGSWGYEARTVRDFNHVFEAFNDYQPHMVLMDISLPHRNGYHWCSEIRKVSSVPIIFLSSASDSMNIVMAMNMGGDDFIAKPFDLNVLSAKMHALMRRVYDLSPVQMQLAHRGAVLNTADATLTYEAERIDLTRNEYRILQTLLERKGQIVSREMLMEKLWESDSFVDENTLSVNVTRLRKKLDGAGLEGFITTRKGSGYIIE